MVSNVRGGHAAELHDGRGSTAATTLSFFFFFSFFWLTTSETLRWTYRWSPTPARALGAQGGLWNARKRRVSLTVVVKRRGRAYLMISHSTRVNVCDAFLPPVSEYESVPSQRGCTEEWRQWSGQASRTVVKPSCFKINPGGLCNFLTSTETKQQRLPAPL